MAGGFFQPGDEKRFGEKEPSLAAQGATKFKTEILGQLLNAIGGNRPTFASFARGGPVTTPVPQGLGAGIPALLQLMNQPGAFTSRESVRIRPSSPSVLSDLTQLAVLAVLANKATEGGAWDATKTGAGKLWDVLAPYFGGGSGGESLVPSSPYGGLGGTDYDAWMNDPSISANPEVSYADPFLPDYLGGQY